MDKKTIERLFKRHTVSELANILGVSVRTAQGWKYGRKPSPLLENQIKRIVIRKELSK